MDRPLSNLESDASTRVLLPILGLLGGLGFGILRAWLSGASELRAVAVVVVGGIVGSILGMSAVIATVYRIDKGKIRSLKSLAFLVLVAAVVLWFALTLLSGVFPLGLP
jgi:hypothetical protein